MRGLLRLQNMFSEQISLSPDIQGERTIFDSRKGRMEPWDIIEPLHERADEFIAYARKFVLDPEQAQDIVQDAYIDLVGKVHEGGVKNPEALLRRIIRGDCLNWNEHYDQTREAEPVQERLRDSRQYDTAGHAQFTAAFNDAVSKLPDGQRAAFALCELRGLTEREAASELRVDHNRIHRDLEKARAALRRAL